MHLAVKRMKMILLENLVEAQAPLNVKERSTGKTPLHLAVENNDSDTVDILLQVCLSIIFIVRLVQYRVTDSIPSQNAGPYRGPQRKGKKKFVKNNDSLRKNLEIL